MKAKRIALIFTAALMLLCAVPFLRTAVQAYAADSETGTALPDWVPDDFSSAAKYRDDNILIHDDLLCVVSTESSEADSYSFSFQPGQFETVSSARYESENGVGGYRVDLLQAVAPGNAAVFHTDLILDQSSKMYAFSVDEDLNISQVKLPKWFPQNFRGALSFYGRWGKTYISDGVLATVFHERFSEESGRKIEDDFALAYTVDTLSCLCNVRFQKGDDWFLVSLFEPAAPGDAKVIHNEIALNCVPYEYTFRIDDALNIKETDLCAWVPDSDDEFRFACPEDNKAESHIVTHGGYVAFLLQSTAGTGYTWEETANDPELAECIECFDCSPLWTNTDGLEPVGGHIKEVRVYRTKQDGQLELRLDLMPPGRDAEPAESVGGVMQITDNAGMVLLPGEARVTILNAGTGKPVISPFDQRGSFYFDYLIGKENLDPQDGEQFNMSTWMKIPSGVCKLPKLGTLFAQEEYKLWMNASSMPQGYFGDAFYENGVSSGDNPITVSQYTDDIADITVTVQFSAEGDMNDDGAFSLADLVMLSRWLTGSLDAVPKRWKAADFVNDDCLDARDLTLMKRRLLKRADAIEENGLLFTLHTFYGGTGIMGDDLGSGNFDSEFFVIEGDSFYETHNGHWFQNVRLSKALILTVEKIKADTVTVSALNSRDGTLNEVVLNIGEPDAGFVNSNYTVFDGINYSYSIRFDPISPDAPV